MSEENKKNATERLTDLENNQNYIVQALQPVEMMSRELVGLKDALKLLNNKLDSLVKAINQGGTITDEILSKFMVENNVKELTDKLTAMVTSGLLVASDTATNDSFVVINEVDPEGNVVNPRMQFLVSQLQHQEVRTKLEGAKVGSNIAIGDKGATINLLEAYTVVNPQPQAQETATTPDVAPADASATADATAPTAATDTSAPATEASPAAASDNAPTAAETASA